MRTTEFRCPTCGFELWLPITHLSVSTLGFYDDSRFPGRCLLALDEHREHLAEVQPPLRDRYLDDVQRAATAIASVTQAKRINYAVLGNAEPHVHFHLIPRRSVDDDPVSARAPWAHPDPPSPLPARSRRRLIEAIDEAVTR